MDPIVIDCSGHTWTPEEIRDFLRAHQRRPEYDQYIEDFTFVGDGFSREKQQ
jgi:hypothetical protein